MTESLDLPLPEPLPRLFFRRAEYGASKTFAYQKVQGRWQGVSWAEARHAVEETALGLLELGVKPQEPVGILSQTRLEWSLADMAVLSLGAITVGMYPSLTETSIRQLVELSGVRTVFVEDQAQQDKLLSATEGLEPAVKVIVFAERAGGSAVSLDELRRKGAQRRDRQPDELRRRLDELRADSIATYIYTSGTTGVPKGVMLTHANFHYTACATEALIPYGGEVTLVFLPLAHSFQRMTSYLVLFSDVEAYFAESLAKVPDNLLDVRPTCFAVVPRVLEKIRGKAIETANDGPPIRQRLFERSMGVLHRYGEARRAGGVPGLRDRVKRRVADKLVASRVRSRMGGRVKFIGSGGAPLSRAVHEFFEDIGIRIIEGYGLSETCAPACMNTLDAHRVGTVGRPLPGTEVKIADDGEILIRGPGVFKGYHNDEAATKAAFDERGWFKTGDLGSMSRDGFLTITGRKKDIIVTAGGKNVAPMPIEVALKRHPYISQAVVVGDERPYLTALVTLDPDVVPRLIEQYGVSDSEALTQLPAVKSALDQHLETVNADRASFEQVKKLVVLPEDLSIESGTLTPTLKVKRNVVTERYADRIAGLYG